MGAAMALSLQHRVAVAAAADGRDRPATRSSRNYRTKDDRFVALCCLQAAKYWPEACEVIGRPELADDERFADTAAIAANAGAAADAVRRGVRRAHARRVARALERLLRPVGDGAGHARGGGRPADASPTATCSDCETADGVAVRARRPRRSSSTSEPARPQRAPEFNEHGDAILADLGLDWDAIVDLKVRGVVA